MRTLVLQSCAPSKRSRFLTNWANRIIFETPMTADIQLAPRLERRIAERWAALDLQRPLPAAIVDTLDDELRVRLTYLSNAIEVNTLSLFETKMAIEEGVTISGQLLRYYLEARNHAAALDQVRALAEKNAP